MDASIGIRLSSIILDSTTNNPENGSKVASNGRAIGGGGASRINQASRNSDPNRLGVSKRFPSLQSSGRYSDPPLAEQIPIPNYHQLGLP